MRIHEVRTQMIIQDFYWLKQDFADFLLRFKILKGKDGLADTF